jgi:hypothetical protein
VVPAATGTLAYCQLAPWFPDLVHRVVKLAPSSDAPNASVPVLDPYMLYQKLREKPVKPCPMARLSVKVLPVMMMKKWVGEEGGVE